MSSIHLQASPLHTYVLQPFNIICICTNWTFKNIIFTRRAFIISINTFYSFGNNKNQLKLLIIIII